MNIRGHYPVGRISCKCPRSTERKVAFTSIQDRSLDSQRVMAFFNWYLCTLWDECEPLWKMKKYNSPLETKHSCVKI